MPGEHPPVAWLATTNGLLAQLCTMAAVWGHPCCAWFDLEALQLQRCPIPHPTNTSCCPPLRPASVPAARACWCCAASPKRCCPACSRWDQEGREAAVICVETGPIAADLAPNQGGCRACSSWGWREAGCPPFECVRVHIPCLCHMLTARLPLQEWGVTRLCFESDTEPYAKQRWVAWVQLCHRCCCPELGSFVWRLRSVTSHVQPHTCLNALMRFTSCHFSSLHLTSIHFTSLQSLHLTSPDFT